MVKNTKYNTGLTAGYRISSIPPENIELNTWYSLTINPQIQKDDYRLMLMDTLYDCPLIDKDISFVLYPEISKGGRTHWHGVVSFMSHISIYIFYKRIPYIMDYAIEIDTISDWQVWLSYCLKQEILMKSITHHYGTPYVVDNYTLRDYLKRHHKSYLKVMIDPDVPIKFNEVTRACSDRGKGVSVSDKSDSDSSDSETPAHHSNPLDD